MNIKTILKRFVKDRPIWHGRWIIKGFFYKGSIKESYSSLKRLKKINNLYKEFKCSRPCEFRKTKFCSHGCYANSLKGKSEIINRINQ